MDIPLVYHPDYSFELPARHRFPMDKFARLHDLLRDSGILHAGNLHSPDICSRELLSLAHAPDYVERFLDNQLSPKEQRRMGLPWSERLARRTIRAVGGTLLTAELALKQGLACHLAGGTHHAHHDFASGFCIFNDLAITSRYLLAAGKAQRILIFDCDVHQGDALGLLAMTDQGIAQRDRAVLEHCLGRDIPVCAVIGGGYSDDRAALARRHALLHQAANAVWQARGMG